MILFGEYVGLMYLYRYETEILNMEIDRYILEKFFMNEADAAETAAIELWLNEDETNRTEFQKAYDHFVLTTLTVSKMELKAEMTRVRKESKIRRLRRIAVYAASVAAALIAGAFLNMHFNGDIQVSGASQMLALSTDPGQRANLALPDGTVVKLNSGSTLEYPAVFSRKERRVRINGEAMFDVAKDEGRPFIVETFAYDVKVLGTKFNVIAEEENGEFSTALLEGKVSVMDKTGADRAILTPSQLVSLEDGALKLSTIRNIEDEYLWTEGILSVAGVPFDKLVQRIERCYGVNIVVEKDNTPPVRYRRMKVRISDGIEFALNAIQRESDFKWRYDDITDTYYIY